MKKTIVLALALSMALAVAGCAKTGEPAATAASEAVSTTAETAQEESTPAAAVEETTTVAETVTTDSADAAAGVMTYEEYMAADLDSQVVIETYVQAKQSWWPPFTARIRTALISCTIWHAQRKIMSVLFREPRSV